MNNRTLPVKTKTPLGQKILHKSWMEDGHVFTQSWEYPKTEIFPVANSAFYNVPESVIDAIGRRAKEDCSGLIQIGASAAPPKPFRLALHW